MHVHALRLASHYHLLPLTWLMAVGVTLLLVSGAWALNVTATWAYPSSRVAPLQWAGGVHIGGMDEEGAVAALGEANLEERSVDIVIDTEVYTATPADMGMRVEAGATIRNALSEQRNARGYGLNGGFWGGSTPLVVEVDEEEFKEFYETDLAAYHGEPVDARLVIDGDEARTRPGETSWRIDRDALARRVSRAVARGKERVPTSVGRRHPEVTAKQLEPLREKAQRMLEHELALEDGDNSYRVPAEKLQGWIVVDEEAKVPRPVVDEDQVRGHVKTLAEDIDEEAEPAHRTLEDGDVLERDDGKPGRQVAVDATVETAVEAIEEGDSTIDIVIEKVEPKREDTRTYTATNHGIEALLSDFASRYSGDYGLTVYTLDGEIEAHYQGNKRFVAASTYKMYLAYAVYAEIESGRLERSTGTGKGSVAHCIKIMLTYSTNPCAVALGETVGWDRADGRLDATGFPRTKLNNRTQARRNKHTTSVEAARLMRRLRTGELLEEDHTQEMLGYLRHQIYRDGIPSGVPDATVANKIGFLDGYLHDVGVVENGERSFVLSIYSYGGQWWQFAQLSGEVKEALDE